MQGQHAGNGHRAYRLRPLNPPRTLTCLPPSGPIAIHHITTFWYLMHCMLVLLQEPKETFIPYNGATRYDYSGGLVPGSMYTRIDA